MLVLCLCSAPAAPEIYRYQDEYGGWHFTDDPPPGVEADPILDITETSKPRATMPTVDLAAQLEGAYAPITPIARASLAVVTVKSALGVASGFFCSEQGHILTSRRLVRPADGGDIAEVDDANASRVADPPGLEEQLRRTRNQLALMEKDLAGYERVLARASDATTRQWAQDSYDRLSSLYRAEQEKARTLSAELGATTENGERLRRDPDSERGSASEATSFDVVLKDGTELVADLVATAGGHDLALLKIDGFRTPYLRLDGSVTLSQGQRVFAIGNPPGMQESVTSGVITGITAEHIFTDAQIPPGNSGGPLITDSGALIGIIVDGGTAAESPDAAGIARSIPVHAARSEFGDELPADRAERLTPSAIEAFPPPAAPQGGFTWD